MQSIFALSFPHGNNIVSQIKKNTNSHIIGVTSISKYHNWIQLKLNHLLIHEAQLGFFSFKPPYCFWVFRLIKPPLIVMIEMPSATAIGLSPEVLVQSSLEQRIGVNQQGPVLRECFIKKSKRLLVWKSYTSEIYISCVALSSPRCRCLSKWTSYREISDSTELSTWNISISISLNSCTTHRIFHSNRTKTMQDDLISFIKTTVFSKEILDGSLGINCLWVLGSNKELKW